MVLFDADAEPCSHHPCVACNTRCSPLREQSHRWTRRSEFLGVSLLHLHNAWQEFLKSSFVRDRQVPRSGRSVAARRSSDSGAVHRRGPRSC